MAIYWACPLSVAAYAALGRRAPAPRFECPLCGRPLSFDGRYPRRVRERGETHTIFVRRAECRRCGVGDALVPHFVLRRRRDSASAVGAAVLGELGTALPEGAEQLYAGVSERTVGSWRQRFAVRASEFSQRLVALSIHWGGQAPAVRAFATPATADAVSAIGEVWRAATRKRTPANVPAAWPLANLVVGGQLLATRVDLPWPIVTSAIGRSRAP